TATEENPSRVAITCPGSGSFSVSFEYMYTSSLEDLQQYIYNKLEIDHKNGNLVDAGEFEQPFENMVGINAIVTYNGINYGLYCYGILTTPGRAIVTIIGTRDEAIVSHYHNIVQSISFAQPS